MDVVGDVRHAFRTLARSPGFPAVALVTLAPGVGASVAMFSAVEGVLLSPLPYEDPHRRVTGNGQPGHARGGGRLQAALPT